jgi:hypothetical protein
LSVSLCVFSAPLNRVSNVSSGPVSYWRPADPGGSSGIGVTAIQIAKALRHRVGDGGQ